MDIILLSPISSIFPIHHNNNNNNEHDNLGKLLRGDDAPRRLWLPRPLGPRHRERGDVVVVGRLGGLGPDAAAAVDHRLAGRRSHHRRWPRRHPPVPQATVRPRR